MTPHWNYLGETVLLMGHNLRFKEILWKIILKFSLFTPSYLEHYYINKERFLLQEEHFSSLRIDEFDSSVVIAGLLI